MPPTCAYAASVARDAQAEALRADIVGSSEGGEAAAPEGHYPVDLSSPDDILRYRGHIRDRILAFCAARGRGPPADAAPQTTSNHQVLDLNSVD